MINGVRRVLGVLPADAAEDAGLCAGTTFTKAKAATDFPSIVGHLPPGAAADDEYVAVQVPVALLIGRDNVVPHSKRVDEVRPLFEDHGDAAVAWYNAHRAYTPESSAALLAAAADMGALASRPGTPPGSRSRPPTTTSSRPSLLRWRS